MKALLPLRLPQGKLKAFSAALAVGHSLVVEDVTQMIAAIASLEAWAYAYGVLGSVRTSPSTGTSQAEVVGTLFSTYFITCQKASKQHSNSQHCDNHPLDSSPSVTRKAHIYNK